MKFETPNMEVMFYATKDILTGSQEVTTTTEFTMNCPDCASELPMD